jgi:ATP-dependent helicase/nuclease subunit B
MPRTRVTSPHAWVRRDRAMQFLAEQAAMRPVLVLAQRKRAVDELTREVANVTGGLLGVTRGTLDQWAEALGELEMGERGVEPLPPLTGQALMARALHRVQEESGPLGYLAKVAEQPGLVRALHRTLEDLRLAAVSASDLGPLVGAVGEDLTRVWGAYSEELRAHRSLDRAQLLEQALEVLRTTGCFRGHALLLLDLEPESQWACQLLSEAVDQAEAVLATGLPTTNRLAETFFHDSAFLLEAEAAEEDPPRALDALRSRLASSSSTDVDTPFQDNGSLTVFSASDEVDECLAIARRIQVLATSGTRFDEMAIFLEDASTYQPVLADALKRAEIPAFFAQERRLPHVSGRAFLALLRCRQEDFSAARFQEFLSYGVHAQPQRAPAGMETPLSVPWSTGVNPAQLSFSIPVAKPSFDASLASENPLRRTLLWQKQLGEAQVLRGKARYPRRLAGLKASMTRKLEASVVEGAPETVKNRLAEDLRAVEDLQTFTLPVIAALDALPVPGTSDASWHSSLVRLAITALHQPDEVLSVLQALLPWLELGSLDLDQVQARLAAELHTASQADEERRYGKVFVGEPDDAPGRTFRVVFVPGLCEGAFGRRASEDPILLDRHRQLLSSDLALRADRMASETRRFHWVVGAATEQLVASYPEFDAARGRARVPSLFLVELLRALQGRLPDLAHLGRRLRSDAPGESGWSAPVRPKDAVDQRAFDLSILSAALAAGDSGAGMGAYLLDTAAHDVAPPPWVRSLRARAQRWRAPFTPYDGLVDPTEETLAILRGHLLEAQAYSPSALQQFASCPYRFHLYALVRLREWTFIESTVELDPTTRGSLFHAVQHQFFERHLAPNETQNQTVDAGGLAAQLRSVFDEVVLAYREELAPDVNEIWYRDTEAVFQDLRRHLEQSWEEAKEWAPAASELAFGLPLTDGDRDQKSQRAAVKILGRYWVRGSIDRVERNRDTDVLRVIDYKTGRFPTGKRPVQIGQGEVLQPLVYALAAQEMLRRSTAQARLAYATDRGGFRNIDFQVNERSVDALKTLLETVDSWIGTGFLPAAPRADACKFCDYQPICGPVEAHRVTRKHQERLEPLLTLRRAP